MSSSYKELFKKHDIKPSKRLGQNFLIDESVLKKIIDAANLSSKDIVLEIGPGLGVLTIELAKRAKKIIAVEKDGVLCQILKSILQSEGINNVEVINKDILQISNFPACVEASADRQFLISNYKIIANLPYYLTAPVIRKFLEIKNPPKEMILMVQKEVAQRIVAGPPKMSVLAIGIQFYAKPKIISYVSKESFWPQPKVDSAIIKITPKDIFPRLNTDLFFKIVKAGFSSRRKMLKNNLKLDESILKKIGLNPKVRAENLSVEDWIKLYEAYKAIKK